VDDVLIGDDIAGRIPNETGALADKEFGRIVPVRTVTPTPSGDARSNGSTVARSTSASTLRRSIVPAVEAAWM
jgi:hypothetical protein